MGAKKNFTKEGLLLQLLVIKKRMGNIPKARNLGHIDFLEKGNFAGATTFSRYFGSFKNAIKEAK